MKSPPVLLVVVGVAVLVLGAYAVGLQAFCVLKLQRTLAGHSLDTVNLEFAIPAKHTSE